MKAVYPHYLKENIKIFGLEIKPLFFSFIFGIVLKSKFFHNVNIMIIIGACYLAYFLYSQCLPDSFFLLLLRKKKFLQGKSNV